MPLKGSTPRPRRPGGPLLFAPGRRPGGPLLLRSRGRPGGPLLLRRRGDKETHYNPPQGRPAGPMGYRKYLEKDLERSEAFWKHGQPRGLRQAMEENITDAAEKWGFIGFFVDPTGIKEEHRQRMSAYRVLAHEMGYKIGPFKFNRKSYGAIANVWKI